jgi:hypothetical protein
LRARNARQHQQQRCGECGAGEIHALHDAAPCAAETIVF